MAAIAGIIASTTEDLRCIHAMSGSMSHRAASEQHLWVSDPIAARYDPTPFPSTAPHPARACLVQRPATSEEATTYDNERFWLAMDGDIFNADELRVDLAARGHRFRTAADSEVVLAAFKEFGPACLERFNGAFAIVLLDRHARQIMLARDRFGIRPLFYCAQRHRLSVASEIKALLCLPELRARLERHTLVDFICHGNPARDTASFFAHVQAFPPAHYALVALDAPTPLAPQPYWQPEALVPSTEETAVVTQFRDLFHTAVALRARHRQPIGACLSGGFDSTAMGVMLREVMGKNTALHSFSACFDEGGQEARTAITLASGAAQSLSNTTYPMAEDFMAELDTLLWHQEQPFPHPARYSQWCLMRTAYEAQVPFVLESTGTNRLFGFHEALHTPPRQGLSALLPWGRSTSERALARLMPNYQPAPPMPEPLAFPLQASGHNGMAFGITLSYPYLDHRLVEFTQRLPASLRQHFGQPKALLHKAMEGALPEPIRQRHGSDKLATPLDQWMQAAILPAFLRDIKQSRLPLVPVIHGGELRELVTRQLHRPDTALTPILFRLFIANRWMQRFNIAPII